VAGHVHRHRAELDPVAVSAGELDGPIVLKGIQHVDDARRAVDAGMWSQPWRWVLAPY
jgi:FMN-dependent dehydrogenase